MAIATFVTSTRASPSSTARNPDVNQRVRRVCVPSCVPIRSARGNLTSDAWSAGISPQTNTAATAVPIDDGQHAIVEREVDPEGQR